MHITPNKPRDFDPTKFTIVGFCANCDHSAPVKRKDEDMEIPTLIERLSCSVCGSNDCSIRIIYTAASGFAYALNTDQLVSFWG